MFGHEDCESDDMLSTNFIEEKEQIKNNSKDEKVVIAYEFNFIIFESL